MKDYYKILEINKEATKSEIVKSFRFLAKKYHPDLNKSTEASIKFREVYEAYEILIDEQKRIKYDKLYNNNPKSNESDFTYWNENVQENEEHSSNQKCRDFLRDIFEGIAKFIFKLGFVLLNMILIIIEFASVYFIGLSLFTESSYISEKTSIINSIILIIFGLFYFGFILKSKDFGFIRIFKNGRKAIIKYSIFFIILLYCVPIYFIAEASRQQKVIDKAIKEQKEMTFIEKSDLDSHINEYIIEFIHSSNINMSDSLNSGVIIIDMDKKTVNYPLTNSLPDSIKTNKNNNVNTLIQLWEFKTKVGTYEDFTTAIQLSCKYKIIDFKTKEVISENKIIGSMPLNRIRNYENGCGSSPIPDLLKLIIQNVKKKSSPSASAGL